LGEYARELTPLIQKSRVVHRVRSHGGEVVCALRASDAEEAEALALDMVQTWREDREPFMSSLRSSLAENLKGHVDDKLANEMAAGLEIQVLVTSMKSMSITVRGNPANPEHAPDFADPRYAGLVALLDMGSEEKVIMH